MTAADLKTGEAGDDGDEENRNGCDRLKTRVQRRVEREDRDEGRGPQRRTGTDRGEEKPAEPRRALGGPGAGEVAHADPGAEQADGTCDQHQHLVVRESIGGGL